MISVDPVRDLPEPTPELLVVGQLLEAFLNTLTEKKRRRFLAELDTVGNAYEALGSVTRLERSRGTAERVGTSRRQSVAWTRAFSEMIRRVPSPRIAG